MKRAAKQGETGVDEEFGLSMDASFDFNDLSDVEVCSPPSSTEIVGDSQTWDYEMSAFPVSASRTSLKEKLHRLGGVSVVAEKATAAVASKMEHSGAQEDADWASLGLSKSVLKSIYNVLGFERPSDVQRQVIPLVMARQDVLVTSETGSGKSAAFLVPLVELLLTFTEVSRRRLLSGGQTEGRNIVGGQALTRALILLPTRELAVQCNSMLTSLVSFCAVTSALVVGGADPKLQAAELRKQPDIVIASPGRLLDLVLNHPGIYLDKVDMVVLDEADRLLDLGFKDEIVNILAHCSRSHSRQTLLFSATLNTQVKGLFASINGNKPVCQVQVTKSHKTVAGLTQEFIKINDESFRVAAAVNVLDLWRASPDFGRAIVFCKEKAEAHRLAVVLGLRGFNVYELHGSLPQAQRVEELQNFQIHTNCVLVSTDLASRGLDLPHIALILNLSLPQQEIETRYVHRVGRTARMGRDGRAVTLYTGDEYKEVKKLLKAIVVGKRKPSVEAELAVDPALTPGSGVFERKLNASALSHIQTELAALEATVTAVTMEETAERDLAMAELEMAQAERRATHGGHNVVKKVWIDSANDRDKQRRMKEGRQAKGQSQTPKADQDKKKKKPQSRKDKLKIESKKKAHKTPPPLKKKIKKF